MLATFVVVTKAARHVVPRGTESAEKYINSICGDAIVAAMRGVGQGRGIAPTLAFAGSGVGFDAHPATAIASATHTLLARMLGLICDTSGFGAEIPFSR